MAAFKDIVVLTGAGISAESGIATFRDTDGIWSKVRLEDVATPEGFMRNPERVLDFYNERRRQGASARPNAAHEALARLEREHSGTVWVVTQNIDVLHETAGTRNLIHMHGQLNQCRCNACGTRRPWGHNRPELSVDMSCPSCGEKRAMRPDVVWFGEMPYEMDRIAALIELCDLFVSIGTSGNVYPAAGFVALARRAGAHTVELNLEPSLGATDFHEAIHGPATEIVPAFVERVLSAAR